MKFRKKPVVIDAVRVEDVVRAYSPVLLPPEAKLPSWVSDAVRADTLQVVATMGRVYVRTAEGVMRGDRGDWLICGVKGELYPCKPDIFEETYEPAEVSS